MKDYYKTLEVHPDASLEVLNNAYRTLVRKYHPDLYHTTEKRFMDARMQEINEAYNVLSNQTTRAEYDRRYRHRQPGVPAFQSAPPRSLSGTLWNMLLWGIGTYVLLRFLIKPLLVAPLVKGLLLFAVVLFLIRLYARPRRR